MAPVRAARLAVMAVFFVNGMVLGNWFPRIPAVQRDLDLGEAELGLALLGTAIGALLAMPVTGWLIARFGSRPMTRASAVALCISLPLPGMAPNLPLLALALVALGASNGALDVSMNAQAVAVERRYGRPIMTTFHAIFSTGGLAGAALAGVIAGGGVDPYRTSSALPYRLSCSPSSRRGDSCRPPLTLAAPDRRSRVRRGRWPDSGSSPSGSCSARARWPTGRLST